MAQTTANSESRWTHRQPPRQPSSKVTQPTCYKEGILFHVSFSHVLIVILNSRKNYAKTFILFLFFFPGLLKPLFKMHFLMNERNVGRHRERERESEAENSSRDIELRKISFVLIVKRKISGH
jgi:hypothetical protein